MTTDDWMFGESTLLCTLMEKPEFDELSEFEQKLFREAFTRGEVSNELTLAHRRAMEWLPVANELIIWGIGFNTYDAELLTVLRVGARDRRIALKKVTVIDTHEERFDLISNLINIKRSKIRFVRAV